MAVYWCKIARSEEEFHAIAQLNYETFVEEIPQHERDGSGIRIDPFHAQNTYLIVLADSTLVGMIALRSERPFSLDRKIGKVEQYLPDSRNICEIRLMAVRKEHRNGRVFFLMARALSDYCYAEGFDAAVISGTTRQLKLYGQLGFQPIAPPVGTGEAVFVPMATTRRRYAASVASRLQTGRKLFLPGPVKLTAPLAAPFAEAPVSHRSAAFQAVFEEVKEKLKEVAGSHPYFLFGSGTLANEAMLAQISRLGSRGLILVNGEFGKRLKEQADRWQLNFDALEQEWGAEFSTNTIEEQLQRQNYGWLLMAHGETSTGVLNDFESLAAICERLQVKLCVDAVSSFGAVPVSFKKAWLATAVSGKAVGTSSGLAIVFAGHNILPDLKLPAYLDLGHYGDKVPYTFSYALLKSFSLALDAYPERYGQLAERLEKVKRDTADWPLLGKGFPTAITFKAEHPYEHFALDAHLSGLELHGSSSYLQEKNLFQVSCIQPDFDADWQQLMKFHERYIKQGNKIKA
ncbi:aminotransferase class V-fold PLP-dependent enzyme [Planococcus ruber]|uniref:aminotransferase class V-fold PLP-dependent enzyme n=1 Tax=Planococcus ruber TaxID=2027871 RepID=UPI003C7ECE91